VVSFIIPHRGRERLRLLDLTIRSIAALPQATECIVVEQDKESRIDELPGNARYLFVESTGIENSWNKCRAFNCGAAVSKGQVLVFQDGDIPLPRNYLGPVLDLILQRDYEVIYPQRFLFHLQERTTKALCKESSLRPVLRSKPLKVRQNWTGGTLAITRKAFQAIGGFDERFKGWSGEDREFYDRCQVLKGWFYGFMPFLHLWHPEQDASGDLGKRKAAQAFTQEILSVPREHRIEALRMARKGRFHVA
jgi:glycosyltransferase involved in cell wall biosynthesis